MLIKACLFSYYLFIHVRAFSLPRHELYVCVYTLQGQALFVECPECLKRFQGPNRQYVLSRHLSTTHAKEKPFACPACPYKAARKDHVYRHYKMVHTKALLQGLFPEAGVPADALIPQLGLVEAERPLVDAVEPGKANVDQAWGTNAPAAPPKSMPYLYSNTNSSPLKNNDC